MNFDDTPEEAAFRAKARAWLETHAEPIKGEPSYDEQPLDEAVIEAAKAWQKKKAEAGWTCITWPKEYGGRGGTQIESVIWSQEESRFQVPPDIYVVSLGMAGPTIIKHGTEEQKNKWIPKLVSGEEIWCQLFSEPASGSDLAGLRTKAVRDGDVWIINGQKVWTTGAQFCDWGILVARNDDSVSKYEGLTYFVVDMSTSGIEVQPIVQMNGGREFNEVFFDDVRIPDAYRIDDVGNGWKVALTTLMNERASIGDLGAGYTVRQLFQLAREVEVIGRPAIEDSAVRQTLAGFYVRSLGVKYTGLRIQTALSQGNTPGPEASISKLVAAPLIQEMSAYALELLGLHGADMELSASPLGAVFQDAYIRSPRIRIAGGTDEVLRNIIAERVLGLPAEVRSDKGVAFRDIPRGH